MSDIDVNTTSKNSTCFLRGVELVRLGNKEFHLCTENWPYPTKNRFGFSGDRYYAEIWRDGMDWTCNYWLIESANWDKPKIYPLMYIGAEEHDKFNQYDLDEIFEATMHYRRDTLWIHQGMNGRYYDSVWPYLRMIEPVENLRECPCMKKYKFLHASQPRVEFYLNVDLIPKQQPVSNKVTLDNGLTIEAEYPIEEKKNE